MKKSSARLPPATRSWRALAAAEHMMHAAERVRQADREFWRGAGGELARNLARDPIMQQEPAAENP